ncbi:hypothetical protein, partial [Dialister sp.]|uniref:hypothetical protein n=1 Tax=Dialister sp. TaxID=1955814 RepID=UPI003F0B7C38
GNASCSAFHAGEDEELIYTYTPYLNFYLKAGNLPNRQVLLIVMKNVMKCKIKEACSSRLSCGIFST